MTDSVKPSALPDHPVLAAWASALNDTGYWAHLLDSSWRFVFESDELRSSFMRGEFVELPLGSHVFSVEAIRRFRTVIGGRDYEREGLRARFSALGRLVLATTPGGRDELRRVIDPDLVDLVDDLTPEAFTGAWVDRPKWPIAGAHMTGSAVWLQINDSDGQFVGVCSLSKPAAGMSHLADAAVTADLAHLDRMRVVEQPDRRPAAILMADLEASTPLARRLSTAQYFSFGRRLVRAADRCIVDTGGIVGRHTGDGVVAFFLADTAGSESAAATACINTARTLRGILPEIAQRSDIPAGDLSLRFGLHWGATMYIGRILTPGRSEVTGLGDEVNEAPGSKPARPAAEHSPRRR